MARGFFRIITPMLGGDRFFDFFFASIWDLRQLVLENGALGPPKTSVLHGFYLEILLWLEDFSLNRVPVLGGDRFLMQFFRLDCQSIFGSVKAFIEKGVEKGVEEDSKLKN